MGFINKDISHIISSIVFKSKIKRCIKQYHSIFQLYINSVRFRNGCNRAFNYRVLDEVKRIKAIWKLCRSPYDFYYMSCTSYKIHKNYIL